jgi:hypothetical protein
MCNVSGSEQLVTIRDVLMWRLQTLERVQDCLLKQSNSPDLLTQEDALLALHSLETDTRLELLHLRLKEARIGAVLR